jgi:uncharacterized membrane protein
VSGALHPAAAAARRAALIATLALGVLCILWEAWLSPLRPGSLLWLKGVPLLCILPGLWVGRRYTYQYSSMMILAWFTEGVMRGYADRGLSQTLALVEVALSVIIFASVVAFARLTRSQG